MPGSWCGAYGGVCKRVYMVYVGLMAAHVTYRDCLEIVGTVKEGSHVLTYVYS